ncbi:MAG TPA: hypothetical protein VEK07_00945 [Polyangiaceae bacterium]|nr:hypothetical protein [Polyangiaceae bacterium]
MTHRSYRSASTVAVALASLFVVRPASAESRTVVAVAPDPQLVRALDVALAPWGTNITEVHPIDAEAFTVMAPDRARAIAQDTRADVVLWVSPDGDHYQVWIYDVASDHASSRPVDAAPPFDPTTAAAVALSVKALLRSTVVAPAPERTPSVPEEPSWGLGLSGGVAGHVGQGVEGRFGLQASAWPAALAHRLGFLIDASVGTGVPLHSLALFPATVREYAFEAGLGAHLPVSSSLAVEPSMSAVVALIDLDATLNQEPVHALRPAAGLVPAVSAPVTFGTRLRLAPWVGLTILTLGVGFNVAGKDQGQVSRFTPEGGLRAELVWP